MNNYTREDILRMVEEEDVGFIRLQFTDIFGTMKNIAITKMCIRDRYNVIQCRTQSVLPYPEIYPG